VNQDRVQRVAEIGYIGLILVIAVVLRREAQSLPPAPYDPLGPGSFPLWVSYGLAALAAAMAVRLVLGRSIGRATHSMVTGLDGQAEHALSPWTAVLLLVFSLLYGTALGASEMPFVAATTAYLFAGGAVLGPLKPKRLLVVAVYALVAAIALDYLFRRLFSLDLN
jgi:Tripartite tricarboxylate transporter TctB family